MSDVALLLNFMLLLGIVLMQRRTLQRWLKQRLVTWQQHRPRHWKPQSPQDCPARFTGHADATLARWLERMGTHSQTWHNFFFRNLVQTLVQKDELSTRIRTTASAAWLWLAFDPVSKAIPSLHLGGRTKDAAFALAHDVQLRLSPDCVPAATTDGLRSYLYALTAHFDTWFRPPKARTDHWQPSAELQYGQLVKRKGKRLITFTHTRMLWGKRHELLARLREAGLRPLIQTAFVERVNLTFRQSVAALSRRTWAYAQTEHHLLLHCEWFRLYYHFVHVPRRWPST